jgi:hypothetical protein
MDKWEKIYLFWGFVSFLMGSIHWLIAGVGVMLVSMAFTMKYWREN